MAESADKQIEQRLNRVTLGLDMYSDVERNEAADAGLDLKTPQGRKGLALLQKAKGMTVVAHPAEPQEHIPALPVETTPVVKGGLSGKKK